MKSSAPSDSSVDVCSGTEGEGAGAEGAGAEGVGGGCPKPGEKLLPPLRKREMQEGPERGRQSAPRRPAPPEVRIPAQCGCSLTAQHCCCGPPPKWAGRDGAQQRTEPPARTCLKQGRQAPKGRGRCFPGGGTASGFTSGVPPEEDSAHGPFCCFGCFARHHIPPGPILMGPAGKGGAGQLITQTLIILGGLGVGESNLRC